MAIAFDAASSLSSGSAGTSFSLSHTTSGTNRVLLVGIAEGISGSISAVTYGGVAMTRLANRTDIAGNNNEVNIYGLIAPASGANNIVVTCSSTQIEIAAASYTGVAQTGLPDASTTAQGSTTSITAVITTIADNAWVVMFGGLQRSMVASTNVTSRANPAGWGTMIGDTNGVIHPAGSVSQTMTYSSVVANAQIAVAVSIAPFVAAASARTRTLTGVGQ